MAKTNLILTELAQGWRLSTPVSDSFEDITTREPVEVVRVAQEFLSKHLQTSRASVVLTVRSDRTLVAQFAPRSSRETTDRQTLQFRFEESLPVLAEDMTSDFIVTDIEILGVGVETDAYRDLIEGLEDSDLVVKAIVPTSLLIAQQLLASNPRTADFLLIRGLEGEDLFQLREGKPMNWWYRPSPPIASGPDEFAAVIACELVHSERTLTLSTACELSQWPSQLQGEMNITHLDPASTQQLLNSAANRVAQDLIAPWINLRQGQLQPGGPLRQIHGPIVACLSAALFLLLSLSVGFFARASQYQRQMDDMLDQQKEIFSAALPQAPVPRSGVVSRLKSEERIMRGARERTQDVQLSPSAVYVAQQVLTALPALGTLNVRELTIDNGSVDIDATFSSFGDVNKVVSSLQENGFAMSPPSSFQEPGDARVTARVIGSLMSNDSARGAGDE